MNQENLMRQDLLLCKIEDMKGEWSREEILAFLKEDWLGFGKTEEVRHGKNGTPLDDSFWNELKRKMNQDGLKERNRLLFGLTVKRTDVRVFPTEEFSLDTPTHNEFDRFQHSSIVPGSLCGVFHFSRDNLWAYVQTPFIRGWVRTRNMAIANNRSDALEVEKEREPLVMTGNFVKVYEDPLFEHPVFVAQMGATFPILHLPEQTKITKPGYVIKIPFREEDGRLTFRKGYIPAKGDVHYGFLPYTQKNLAQQAFKMLHQPYGWGEMSGGRDCSRFIMDLFNAFGILMPRNSILQARLGIPLGPLEGRTVEEKKKILDRAVPLATLVRMPGHIMLYLGKEEGRHYAIHSNWGFQKKGRSGSETQRIGRVVVSDLSLGETGPSGSLLHRTTEIQFIGPDSEVQKKQ
ncbi:MAG: SH3 domain-containing protein [Thermodesulfobacteriota bacterium]|nr:SH3 domain-containing protein [Thermodesulfobacteriota bacterium]